MYISWTKFFAPLNYNTRGYIRRQTCSCCLRRAVCDCGSCFSGTYDLWPRVWETGWCIRGRKENSPRNSKMLQERYPLLWLFATARYGTHLHGKLSQKFSEQAFFLGSEIFYSRRLPLQPGLRSPRLPNCLTCIKQNKTNRRVRQKPSIWSSRTWHIP